MRLLSINKGTYLVGRLPWHKGFEVGWQPMWSPFGKSRLIVALTTSTDHAGLSASVELFGYLFEMNVLDDRHWHWKENRFYEPGEQERDDCCEEKKS